MCSSTRRRSICPTHTCGISPVNWPCTDAKSAVAGGGIEIASVYRYIEARATPAPSLADAAQTVSRLAFVILDGTPCRPAGLPPTPRTTPGNTSATA